MTKEEEIEKKHLEFKKIVIRFFKECGLYNEWKIYVNGKKCWYKTAYIDRIIGSSNFSLWLKANYNLHFPFHFSTLFRTYITEIGKSDKYPFRLNKIYEKNSHEHRYFDIDAVSHKINIYWNEC